MDELMKYVADLTQMMEAGTLDDYPTPAPPADLGDPLTQEEIDFIKTLRKEILERFAPPSL